MSKVIDSVVAQIENFAEINGGEPSLKIESTGKKITIVIDYTNSDDIIKSAELNAKTAKAEFDNSPIGSMFKNLSGGPMSTMMGFGMGRDFGGGFGAPMGGFGGGFGVPMPVKKSEAEFIAMLRLSGLEDDEINSIIENRKGSSVITKGPESNE